MIFEPYNPLDEKNLGASVAEALLERDPIRLQDLPKFSGTGIYAIYYTGPFEAYRELAVRNRDGRFEWPIYVGKAVSSGTRKGIPVDTPQPKLYDRLREHAESIRLAANLNLSDFYCRALVVKDIWIPLGESLLIAKFGPVWNRVLDGFGNHDPGKGRYNGMITRWDVVHPGRAWAAKCKPRPETREQLEQEIAAYLRTASVPQRPRFLAS